MTTSVLHRTKLVTVEKGKRTLITNCGATLESNAPTKPEGSTVWASLATCPDCQEHRCPPVVKSSKPPSSPSASRSGLTLPPALAKARAIGASAQRN